MSADLFVRVLFVVALLLATVTWGWVLLGNSRATRVEPWRQRLSDLMWLAGVALAVLGTVIAVVNDRWNVGSLVLAIAALNGWALERQQRRAAEDALSGHGQPAGDR